MRGKCSGRHVGKLDRDCAVLWGWLIVTQSPRPGIISIFVFVSEARRASFHVVAVMTVRAEGSSRVK